jgi:hypothetical protein
MVFGGAAHWNKIIAELIHKSYTNIRAVEIPLTFLTAWKNKPSWYQFPERQPCIAGLDAGRDCRVHRQGCHRTGLSRASVRSTSDAETL